jgi:segregation and condensation protein B
MRLTQIVEALLFASDAPLTAGDIARIDERLDEDTVEAVVQELRGEYEETERAFQIYEVAGGYQLLTRPDFAMHLERFETVPHTTKLSSATLEALAIIAYRQPIGRAEVEEIRGVGSSGALKTLIDRSLIEVVGRGEGLGRPLLYGTTRKFLEHFGMRSLEDMPRPEELPVVLRTRPEPAIAAPETIEAAAAEGTAVAAEGTDASAQPAPDADSAESADTVATGEAAVATDDTTAESHEHDTGADSDESAAIAESDEAELIASEDDVIAGSDEADLIASAEESTDGDSDEFADVIASAEEPEGSEKD